MRIERSKKMALDDAKVGKVLEMKRVVDSN
jgi:hypothetical protein